jgi:hypothetical protein
MGVLNHMHYMGYKLAKTLQTKIYSTGYIRSRTPGNKDPTMKMPHVSGVSSMGITPSSVTNSLDASYAWEGGIVRNNVTTHTNIVKLPAHVKSVQITLDSITLVIHEVSSIIT